MNLKIGQFSDSFLPINDGVGRVSYHYCDSLAKMGHQVYAIVPFADMGYRGDFPFEVIDYYAKPLLTMPQYDAGLPMFDIHYHHHLEQVKMDIVHAHTPFIAGVEAIIYARKNNIPIVGTFHSKYYDDFYQLTGSSLIAGFGRDRVVDFYNHCDEVWTVSENAADTLRDYGYKGEIFVIENGMDLKAVPEKDIIQARKSFSLSEDPVLLYVGQINEKKNLKKTIDACALLKKNGFSFQLVFAGKGPHEQKMKDLAKKNDVPLILTGHLQDESLLNGLYALSDLFVFPSVYDTSSMVVREAANAMTPSLVVKGSAPAEVIQDGFNGLLCDNNVESIYQNIARALSKREWLSQIGINARNSIPVPWDTIAQRATERYLYLINNIGGKL